MARARRSLVAAALAGLVALVASSCASDLGTLGGTSSAAYGIDDAGTVVGVAKDAGGVDRPFRRDGDTMTTLPTLPGFTTGEARSIDGGDAVGWLGDGGTASRAVRWPAGGGAVDLGGLGGATSRALDVNAGGTVVGWSTRAGSTDKVATIWVPGQAPAALPLPSGTTSSQAVAVNDAGDIVGSSGFSPARWTGPTRTFAVLQPPVGFPDISRTVNDIDEDGTAVGSQLAPIEGPEEAGNFAAVWRPGQNTAVLFGAAHTWASAIDDGIVVGSGPASARAWVLATGETVGLPGLGTGGVAYAVANGEPVGSSTLTSGQTHATRFDPVEP